MKMVTIAGFATMFMLASCEQKQEQAKPQEVKITAPVIGQTICPVMGGKIDRKQFVDVSGFRIYVCCAGCQGKIAANPVKFIKKLQESGVTLEKTP